MAALCFGPQSTCNMKTIRSHDYSCSEKEMLSRISEARESLDSRLLNISDFSKLKEEELNDIYYIDSLLKWIQFGGETPSWVLLENGRIRGEKLEEL